MRGLEFRVLRIPFRVQIWFVVTLVLINLNRLDPFRIAPLFYTTYFLEGALVAAFTVIVHELGHCWAYRRYGQEPSVMLWGLGGLTFGQAKLPPKKKIVVSIAGPLTALILLGIPGYYLSTQVFTTFYAGPDFRWFPQLITHDLYWFALLWSLLNLLPILPLDGGHVVEAVLELVHGEPRKQTARLVSVVAGVVFGLWGLLFLFNAFILLLGLGLAALNFIPYWQERNNSVVRYELLPDEDNASAMGMGAPSDNVVSMKKERKKRDRRSPAELLKSGYEALERREYKNALRIAGRLLDKRIPNEMVQRTVELSAWGWLGEHNHLKAEEALQELPSGAKPPVGLSAALALSDNRVDEAMNLMVRCMVEDPDGIAKLIAVDLFADQGMTHRLARELVDLEGGTGFESAVALEGMLHRLHRTQDASTVSDVILLG